MKQRYYSFQEFQPLVSTLSDTPVQRFCPWRETLWPAIKEGRSRTRSAKFGRKNVSTPRGTLSEVPPVSVGSIHRFFKQQRMACETRIAFGPFGHSIDHVAHMSAREKEHSRLHLGRGGGERTLVSVASVASQTAGFIHPVDKIVLAPRRTHFSTEKALVIPAYQVSPPIYRAANIPPPLPLILFFPTGCYFWSR